MEHVPLKVLAQAFDRITANTKRLEKGGELLIEKRVMQQHQGASQHGAPDGRAAFWQVVESQHVVPSAACAADFSLDADELKRCLRLIMDTNGDGVLPTVYLITVCSTQACCRSQAAVLD